MTQDGHIVLDKSAALWTQGLAKPRGGSRRLRLHDPFFEDPPYQQAYGLHQALTADQLRMVKDRDYLKVATMTIPTGFPQERNLRYMEHRVGLEFTCFDTLTHSDAEILAIVASLPFEFEDPPMWRPCVKTQSPWKSVWC
jgi:hypothetical protein